MNKAQDTQFTADELALMNGTAEPDQDTSTDDTPAVAVAENDDEDQPEGDTAPAEAAPAAADEAPASDEPAAAEPFIPKFDATGPENYDEAKKAIRDEKTALRAKWSSGDLTDEQFAEAEAAVEDKMEALQAEFLTSQALARANQQIQAQQATQTLNAIATQAKAQGIDYADEGLAILFDAKMKAVKADQAFAGKDFADIAAEAHKRVASLLGKDKQQPTGTKADGAPPAERVRIPPTLSGMPAAAAMPVGQDLAAQLDAIDDPDQLEARWASLPTAQRNAMLRSTLPQPGRR